MRAASGADKAAAFHSSSSDSVISHTAQEIASQLPLYLRGMQRRWHFLLAEPLTPQREAELRAALSEALQDWNSHGRPISWELNFPYGHFVEVIAKGPVSGCATDALFRAVLPLAQPLPTDWIAILHEGNIFTKKFYEIVNSYKVGAWPAEARLLEPGAEGIQVVPIEESRLRVHLS